MSEAPVLKPREVVALAVDNWLSFDGPDANPPSAFAVAVAGDGIIAFGYNCGDANTFKQTYINADHGVVAGSGKP